MGGGEVHDEKSIQLTEKDVPLEQVMEESDNFPKFSKKRYPNVSWPPRNAREHLPLLW